MLNRKQQADNLVRWGDIEVSVEAAAVLLSLAMRDTEQPVGNLGRALSRLSARLHRQEAAAPGATREVTTSKEGLHAELGDDVAVCIQSLQFHDRLIQQLAAVRSFLASLADHRDLKVSGFGAQRWEDLLRLVRTRLTADSHNQLFELLLRTGEIDDAARAELKDSEGSVELF